MKVKRVSLRVNLNVFTKHCTQNLEAATGGVLLKMVFLNISQNSQENTCARVFFDEVSGLRPEPLVPATIIQYYCSPNLLEMDSITTLFLFFLQSFSKQLFFQHTSEQLEVFILDPSYGKSYKIAFVCLSLSFCLSFRPSVSSAFFSEMGYQFFLNFAQWQII